MSRAILVGMKPQIVANPQWRVRVTERNVDSVFGEPNERMGRARFISAKIQYPHAIVLLEQRIEAEGLVSYEEVDRCNGGPL